MYDLTYMGNLKNNKNKKKTNKKEHQANRNRELVVARGWGQGVGKKGDKDQKLQASSYNYINMLK